MGNDQRLWDRICSYQDLRSAWLKVNENRGGPGVDRITLEQFEHDLDDNLRLLQHQLDGGEYKPLPVLRIYVGKSDGKERPIGIPAIRDRVVQHSLLSAISPVFEEKFLDCSFAYRPGRSALDAIAKVEDLIKNGCPWVLDADIKSFFDTIDRTLLLQFVAQRIHEDKVLSLVGLFVNSGVFENMSVRDEYLGIAQGNVISPLLANIYLHPMDQKLTDAGYHLIRYADDFVVLEASQEKVAKALADTTEMLRELRLSFSEKKTRMLHAREGLVFLGYYIDTKGKGASKKAIEAISSRLSDISRRDGEGQEGQKKTEELEQCLRGWTRYFHTCRGIEPGDSSSMVALMDISVEAGDEENAKTLLEKRNAFTIDDADVHYRLGVLAQRLGMRNEALDEFSQAMTLQPNHFAAGQALKEINLVDEDVYGSIGRLKRLIHHIPNLPQAYRDLSQCYVEIGQYGLAKEAYQKATELEPSPDDQEPALDEALPPSVEPAPLSLSEDEVSLFLSLFRGKQGYHASQWVDERGRRGFYPVARSLGVDEIRSHVAGENTLGLYVMAEEDKVYLSVIDIDVDTKALLEYAKDEQRLAELQHLTNEYAAKVASVCEDLGITPLLEDSGYKGRHLWFFFSSPIPAKLARSFLRFVCDKAGDPPPGIHREIFPTSDKVKGQGFGCLIKLPLGIHKKTGRRCLLLDRAGNPLSDQVGALSGVKMIPPQRVAEILLAYSTKAKETPAKKEASQSAIIGALLSGCGVIRHLVGKAEEVHYLDNAERVTLLYTLGHLGQEGKDFLHRVMSNCINYDYDITESYIKKVKPSPISCARIREKHEEIVHDVGCTCNFRLPPRGYPSPVLHALGQMKTTPSVVMPFESKRTGGVTMESTNKDDIQGWLKKYIELKRQLRGVQKSISRVEEGMGSCLDQMQVDRVETEYGTLERKKSADGSEWIIRL